MRVWEQDSGGHGDDFEDAFFYPAVTAAVTGVADGDVFPGQGFELVAQCGLTVRSP
jgi:hypothetical protein